MPSGRDNFRRNRVAPLGLTVYHPQVVQPNPAQFAFRPSRTTLLNWPNISDCIGKRAPGTPIAFSVTFTDVKLATVGVRQFKDARIIARVRKSIWREFLSLARLVTYL